jgi:hypothetical protein
MIIYKNIGLDNIRKKKEKRINTFGDVCWFFRSFRLTQHYYINSLNWLPSNINIDVNLLTKGSYLLTYQENITIFLNILLNILKTPMKSSSEYNNLQYGIACAMK